MRLIVNADDFGLTRGITDTILETIDGGALNGVSVVPNGEAFEYARAALAGRRKVRVAAHLNLIEGRPAASPTAIPALLKAGRLQNSFQSLWLRYGKASSVERRGLTEQVRAELSAQLRRFSETFGGEAVHVDSHQHVHMVPFVFDTLVDLASAHRIRSIRIPREPPVLPRTIAELGQSLSANAVKHALLNRLSARAIPRLRRAGISHCEYFVGVQFTGSMTESVVARALRRIAGRVRPDQTIEVLFHPGAASRGEESQWADHPRLGSYYFSPWRSKESAVLRSPSFAALIARYDAR